MTEHEMFNEIGAVAADFQDGMKTREQCLAMAPVLAERFNQHFDRIDIAAWIEEDLDRIAAA